MNSADDLIEALMTKVDELFVLGFEVHSVGMTKESLKTIMDGEELDEGQTLSIEAPYGLIDIVEARGAPRPDSSEYH